MSGHSTPAPAASSKQHPAMDDETQRKDSDQSLQFFKEERTSDAVYNVYLKKVQYHIDSNSSNVDCDLARSDEKSVTASRSRHHHLQPGAIDEDRRAHLQWRLEEVRVIKYGSLRRLVAALSSDTGQLEATNVNTFLTTCKTFASTKDVVDELINRYRDVDSNDSMKADVKEGHLNLTQCSSYTLSQSSDKTGRHRTIRTVIWAWLESHPDDFNESPSYSALNSLREFTQLLPSSELYHKLNQRLAAFRTETSVTTPLTSAAKTYSSRSQSATERHQDFNANFATSSTDILSVPSRHVAEQLTYIDAELFKRVNTQQCLGSVWSRRQNSQSSPSGGATSEKSQQAVDSVATVSATVNQFNAVTYRVIATIVRRHVATTTQPSHADRATIIEKWIDTAQECRRLKNFSSLKAIISGLQCTAVYRLRRVWTAVNRQKMTLYEELSAIFSEENNQQTWREVLNKEGTAKFASDTVATRTLRARKKSWSWGTMRTRRSHSLDSTSMPTVQGTVPYLGTFLTDLTMVDTAFPDTTDDGLINFDKRRREFEILTQIKLFQSAASLYHITPDVQFNTWFKNIPVYDDNESYQLSCEIEPEIAWQVTSSPFKPRLNKFSFCHRSALRLTMSVTSPDGSTDDLSDLDCSLSSSRSSTLRSPLRRLESSQGTPETSRHSRLRHSISAGSLLSPTHSARCNGSSSDAINRSVTSSIYSDDRLVVKVFLASEDSSVVHYKSILLANSDHTNTVLKTVLTKFNLSSALTDYLLVQSLPDGAELSLPEKGNIFYAVNTSVPEIKFVLRKKKSTDLERHSKKSR